MTRTKVDPDQTGLDSLAVTTHPARDAAHFRRIIAARRSLAGAEEELRDAVRAASRAGCVVTARLSRPVWSGSTFVLVMVFTSPQVVVEHRSEPVGVDDAGQFARWDGDELEHPAVPVWPDHQQPVLALVV